MFSKTDSAENKAPCWNSMPRRRRRLRCNPTSGVQIDPLNSRTAPYPAAAGPVSRAARLSCRSPNRRATNDLPGPHLQGEIAMHHGLAAKLRPRHPVR